MSPYSEWVNVPSALVHFLCFVKKRALLAELCLTESSSESYLFNFMKLLKYVSKIFQTKKKYDLLVCHTMYTKLSKISSRLEHIEVKRIYNSDREGPYIIYYKSPPISNFEPFLRAQKLSSSKFSIPYLRTGKRLEKLSNSFRLLFRWIVAHFLYF